MEQTILNTIYPILPNVLGLKTPNVSFDYDKEADVLYVNFDKPAVFASDSKLYDNDVLVRFKGKKVVGITILHASRFSKHKK